MYEQHEVFQAPENTNVKLWRYMDFTKLVSLLDRKALFFARADRLGDPFEGSYSLATIAARPAVFGEQAEAINTSGASFFRALVKWTAINCWHMQEYESAAMWDIYARSGYGVAVRTTFAGLTESLRCEEPVYVGKVHYIDYVHDLMPHQNAFFPFVHKRRSFSHENELRALIQAIPMPRNGEQIDLEKETFIAGKYVEVDLNHLIQKIYVAPLSPQWFVDLVRSVIRLYQLSIDVRQSALDKDPIF